MASPPPSGMPPGTPPPGPPMTGLTPKARGMLAAYVIMASLSITAVVLRLFANNKKRKRLGADDYTIVACLVLAVGMSAESIWAITQHLLGVPRPNISSIKIRKKHMFAGLLVSQFTIGLIKISCVLFYRKIFVTRKFLWAANIMLGVLIIWTTLFFFLDLLQTTPVNMFWEYTKIGVSPYSNWEVNDIVYAFTLSDMLLDIIVVAMPLFVIRSLKLATRKKFLVSGIFLLGAFCIIASGIRFQTSRELYLMTPADPRFLTTTDTNSLWAGVETNASIVTACLPTFGPLFLGRSHQSLTSILRSFRSRISLRSRSDRSDGDSAAEMGRGSGEGKSYGSSAGTPPVRSVEDVGKAPGSAFVAVAGYGGANNEKVYRRDGDIVVEKTVRQEGQRA